MVLFGLVWFGLVVVVSVVVAVVSVVVVVVSVVVVVEIS